MAEQDASVAVQNALQKLEQGPNLLQNGEKLDSVKSKLRKLRRYGSRLDKLNYSVSELTDVREFANDVEDAMDDAIMVYTAEAARKRWRLLTNFFMFISRANQISKQQLEEQIDEIDNRSLGRSTCDDAYDYDVEEIVVEDEDLTETPPQKDLFYLSLSGFREDVEISARRLIQVWMAEKFLEKFRVSRNVLIKEAQGREQIDRLLQQGFITEVHRGTCGNLKTFKICTEKLQACRSAADTENFLRVNMLKAGQTPDFTTFEGTKRLSIHIESTRDLFTGCDQRTLSNLSKVRSLHIHCVSPSSNKIASDFGFLRPQKNVQKHLWVLDLGCLEVEVVPEVIGKLTHLRYLRLKASKGTKIPASICNLQNLQTIDLKDTKSVKTMPVEIWKMKENLQYLHLGGATALPPPRRADHYAALENLQTLCGIRPDKELKRLMVRAKFPNVKRLSLQKTKNDSPDEFLSVLNSLDHLYHLRSLTIRGAIKDLPSDWNAFPSSLTKMTLWRTLIPAETCARKLQNLPNLRFLKLMEESISGVKMQCDDCGFPALQVLRMVGIKELCDWRVGKGAMRLLRDLEVKGCPKLIKVEVIQPSTELWKTLQKLQAEHQEITVDLKTK